MHRAVLIYILSKVVYIVELLTRIGGVSATAMALANDEVTHPSSGQCSPTPVRHWLPSGTIGIPSVSIVAEVVVEIQTPTGFVKDRQGPVHIKVGEVDDIRAATEG